MGGDRRGPRIGETLNTLVYNQYWSGDVRGAEEARRAVELSEGSGDSPALALACTALSGVLMMADDPATATWAERSRVVAARLGRPDLEANALNCLGVARMTAGNRTARSCCAAASSWRGGFRTILRRAAGHEPGPRHAP